MKTKLATSKKAPLSVERLQRRCNRLQKERDRLREELVKVSAERDDYRKSVGILMSTEKIEFDKEAILALVDKGQSLEELIAELEAEGSEQCRPTKRRRTK